MEISKGHAAKAQAYGKDLRVVNLDAFRRSKSQPQPPAAEYGRGWYHDAAIKTEKARTHDA